MSETKVQTINLMFPTGERSQVQITKEMTVGDLIDQISNDPKLSHPPNRTIALIYLGRILNDSDVLSKMTTLNDFTIQVFYRAIPQANRTTECPVISSDLRGFDRLLRMDYSREQIAELQHNFHAMHGTLEASREEQIDIEEEWFPVIFNHENPLQDLQIGQRRDRGNGQRTDENPLINNIHDGQFGDDALVGTQWVRFSIGAIAGALFGVGALVFMWLRFNDRPFVLGLFLGIGIHYVVEYFFGLDMV